MDFKVEGLSQHRLSWADRNFAKGNGDDNFKAASRLRTTIEAVVSESLKGVVFLEVGHQNWGVAKDGTSLGTDGKQVKVSWSYVDWSVPKTEGEGAHGASGRIRSDVSRHGIAHP